MGIRERQRQASLILPFVQQLSRLEEEEEEEGKFAFWKFEKSHASFSKCMYVKKENVVVCICTVVLRK
jgi:hypothetical protein